MLVGDLQHQSTAQGLFLSVNHLSIHYPYLYHRQTDMQVMIEFAPL